MTGRLIDQQILVDVSPVGMAVYEKRIKAEGEPTSLQLLQANQAFCHALGLDKIDLNRSPVNIRNLVMAAAGIFGGKAAEKALAINVHVDAQVPDYVLGDTPKLLQVMTNLISNAVKFTDKGEVEVEVMLHQETEKQTWLQVKVKDQGIGVEEAFYEQIFNPFVQADMTVSKRFGGTGLGLSIVKKLVEFMGGTVGVKSRETGGSIFDLLLPFDKENP